MPKKSAARVPDAVLPADEKPKEYPNSTAIIQWSGSADELIQTIEKKPESLATQVICPAYGALDMIEKRAGGLKKKLIDIVKKRREEKCFEKDGDEDQHRLFIGENFTLQVQEKGGREVDFAKASALLKEKKLYDNAVSVAVTEMTPKFQAFLRKHRAEIREMGIKLEETIELSKLNALVETGMLTLEDVQSITREKDKTYAVIVKAKK